MSVNYTWQIIALKFQPPVQNLNNVAISSADWSVFANDSANNLSMVYHGTTSFSNPDLENTLVLTENIMINRVQNTLGTNAVSNLESQLANTMVTAFVNNPDWSKTNTQLPWYSA